MIWVKNHDYSKISEIIRNRLSEEDIEASNDEPIIHNLLKAIDFAKDCMRQGMPVTIIGDYDCDGITSSSILKLGLTEYLGIIPEVIIPKRLTEGYGVNISIIDRIPCGLVIMVDNGIAAVEQIKYAKAKGLKTIIIDHHDKRDDGIIPPADVVIDPSAEDTDCYKHYCGAGLAYRFIKALNPQSKILDKLVTLAGIGTIADVMTLKGHNRWLVKESLKNVSMGNVPFGLKILLDRMGIGEYVTESDYGFGIGPTFNAAGRLYDDGGQRMTNFITTDESLIETPADLEFLKNEADNLIAINEERKEEVFKEMETVNMLLKDTSPIIVIQDDSFKKGIVGILAGKLTEQYKVPALVFARDTKNPNNFTGSGRSPENLHLKKLLDKVSYLLEGYGGHAGAAGLTVKEENFDKLIRSLKNELEDFEPESPNVTYYDLQIGSANQIEPLYEELRKYAPYGEGNKPIIFRFDGFNGVPKVMGKHNEHFKIEGNGVNILGFHLKDKWDNEGCPTAIDVIGEISLNHFNETVTPQIEIQDFHKKEIKQTTDYNDLAGLFSF